MVVNFNLFTVLESSFRRYCDSARSDVVIKEALKNVIEISFLKQKTFNFRDSIEI